MDDAIRLFLGGDVMTGRGIDQILPHPSKPHLFEAHVASAEAYLLLAERASGPIPRRVAPSYVWGDALAALARLRPDVRIVNLETAVTTAEQPAAKGIHYRMDPANIACLAAARLDCCTLANNHVLDWGRVGLRETLDTLRAAGLRTAGAGSCAGQARAPAVLDLAGRGRVLVFAFGTASSGIPPDWAAGPGRPGVARLPDLSPASLRTVAEAVAAARRPGDLVVISLHWGGNWGFELGQDELAFGQWLVEEAGVDLVHGHSSHHARAIQVHRGRLVLHGCGDLLNDYEGIGGYEAWRDDLAVLHLATLAGRPPRLAALDLEVMQIRRFRLNAASAADTAWLARTLGKASRRFGTRFHAQGNRIRVGWP
ncbi:CapA family protein [Geminicoccaceae bacterium 1502E]|nr:CapA family protein [Geminicoccaceae bacterium 1502E]